MVRICGKDSLESKTTLMDVNWVTLCRYLNNLHANKLVQCGQRNLYLLIFHFYHIRELIRPGFHSVVNVVNM